MLNRLLQQRQRQLHLSVIPRSNRFFQNQRLYIHILTQLINRRQIHSTSLTTQNNRMKRFQERNIIAKFIVRTAY